MARPSTARILQKSIRYPTYQLTAAASSRKETPECQLVICALSVLEWIRTKLKAFEIPEMLKAPGPDEYDQVSIEDLKSIHINEGYTVETVCIPEEKIWAFRLVEPDLSMRWEKNREISTAVPGRMFETNIAFRVEGSTMYCGIKLIVSEPENTPGKAIVLRPAVVEKLAKDPRIGLSVCFPIDEKAWELKSRQTQKQLRDMLRSTMLPAVVFCDYEDPEEPIRLPKLGKDMMAPPKREFSFPIQKNAVLPVIPAPRHSEPYVPYNIDLFAHKRMAYMHCFHLPASQFSSFQSILQIPVNSGDALFLEPAELGGGIMRFPYSPGRKQENFSKLMDTARDYMREKPVKFSHVEFLTGAKRRQLERYQSEDSSSAETAENYKQQMELLQDNFRDEIMRKNEKIQAQASKITRLKSMLEEKDTEKERVHQQAEEKIEKERRKVKEIEEQLTYFKSLLSRPKTPQDIPEWVEKRFAGRLIFHPRAVKLIEAVPANGVDMALLCDAIEYLAQEYRDIKAGLLKPEEASKRCSEKYGRPFEVGRNSDTSIAMYGSQYKVKYGRGFKGKPVETSLNEHLKVGVSGKNLIRIYFFYDNDNKLIVVGSLPNHLKVAQIQA